MKTTLLLFTIIFLSACGTAVKYTYHFDHYDYSKSKNDQKNASLNNQQISSSNELIAEVNTKVDESEDRLNIEKPLHEKPLQLNPNQLSASAKNTPVIFDEKAESLNKPIDFSVLTKSEKKTFIKQTKTELKSSLKEIKKNSSSKAEGKSQVTALILVLLVGGIGIHRFYLGYTWQGVVQLLTLGLCGVWTLIDLIRILTGSLKPKDGTYTKTL